MPWSDVLEIGVRLLDGLVHLGKCRDRQQKVARRGRGFLQVVHIFERRMVLAEMRPNSTSHRAASDGLRGLHLKRRLELILARRVLTRPYLRRGAAPKRPAIGILLGAQLGDDRPILRGERCRNSQPRTASRSPSPTSAPADAQKHSSNAEPSPSPTPRARAHQARPGTQRHMRSQQCPCSAPAPAPRRTRRSCLTERQRLVSLILQPT